MAKINSTREAYNDYALRLLAVVDALGLSDYKIWNSVNGLSKSYMSDIRNGRKGPSSKVLSNFVAAFPSVSATWLLTGEGEMLVSSNSGAISTDDGVAVAGDGSTVTTDKGGDNSNNGNTTHNHYYAEGATSPVTHDAVEVVPVPTENYIMVEYADLRASAGRLGGNAVENLPDISKRLMPKEFDNGNFLVVRVAGDSMNDGTSRSLFDGDEVLIKERTTEQWQDLPIKTALFVITTSEGNVLKQISEFNKEEGYLVCHSFNPSYKDFRVNLSDVYQIFIVCKIVNKQILL